MQTHLNLKNNKKNKKPSNLNKLKNKKEKEKIQDKLEPLTIDWKTLGFQSQIVFP